MKKHAHLLTYFVWVIVPITAWIIYTLYGLPHILLSYRWVGSDAATYYDERYKTECRFIGPYGGFTIKAHEGSCGWVVRLFKEKEVR
ncbi:hypothetical protein [uncultured Cohaesibacter sp.]|uniref:hypothetical protein n=1 Tax=uncultured Cohaesibacter sp. TaxID=1002546 RepID=UPI00292F68A3|nr:hypothetical protein [uncultured Cohaesibacter sp.]